MQIDNLIVRLVKKKDLAEILEIYKPEILNGYATFEVELPTKTDMWSRIETILKDAPWLVAEHEGKVIGYAYASVFNGRYGYRFTRQVSIYVAPNLQNLKVGQALYSKLFDILEKQGYKNLLALIVKENPRSVHFHKKFGFQVAGEYKNVGYKFGKWRSIEFYQKTLNYEEPEEIKSYETFIN